VGRHYLRRDRFPSGRGIADTVSVMSWASWFLEWLTAAVIQVLPWLLVAAVASPFFILAYFVIRALWRDYTPWNGGV
jgi:hypothetical protein